MKDLNEIKIIDKREGEILYRAMCDYMSKVFKELQKNDKNSLIEINDLLQSLKYFVYEKSYYIRISI